MKYLPVIAFLFASLACPGVKRGDNTPQGESFVTLTILATNDLHGAFDGVRDLDLGGGRLGGVELIAAAVKAVRAQAKGPVLLFDAGDCFQGPLPVNASEGRLCAKFFSFLGYDAVGLGNHEFDYGDCGPEGEENEPRDPQCALKEALREVKVPVVSANVRDQRTGERVPWIRPYVVLERGGVRLGVTSVVPQETPFVSHPGGTEGLFFSDPIEEVRSLLPLMREEGAMVVVVLAHLDGACEGVGDRPTEDGLARDCRLTGALGRFVRAFGPGEIDVVIAGHSHALVATSVGGVGVVESLSQGRLIGRVEVTVNLRTGRVVSGGVRVRPPIPLCGAEDPKSLLCNPRFPGFVGALAADPEAKGFLADVLEPYLATCREVVGEVSEAITHGRREETALSDLTADLMREAPVVIGEEAAEVAFINQGAIRDDLAPGPLTMCDLYRVWPFEDRLVEARMSGGELQRLFEFVVLDLHKWFAISGIRLRVHKEARKVEVLDLAGRPLDPARHYRVVTTSYLARGGDRMDAFLPKGRLRILPFPSHRDAFREVIRRNSPLSPPPGGRVEIVDGQGPRPEATE